MTLRPATLLITASIAISSVKGMTIYIAPELPDPRTAGPFTTALAANSFTPLSPGLPSGIAALFQQDYPGFSYLNSGSAESGLFTVSNLVLLQNGIQGGLTLNASFTPAPGSHAPHVYQWMQYLTIEPLTTPFAGAASSPFTDPPPNDRDDNLPFYWTVAERNTPDLGYVGGLNASDYPLFSDAIRTNDTRAPVKVRLFLYLTDFDQLHNAVTVYDGVEYGFDITSVPEPATHLTLIVTLPTLVARFMRKQNRS